VHGAGGNVLFLWGAARSLAADRSVFAFQARGVSRGDEMDPTVEAMASRYVRELRDAASGPYLLAGYSGGGVVTMEMVRQLQAAGERVSHVVLFDSLPSGFGMPNRARRAINVLDNARRGGRAAVAPRYHPAKIRRAIDRRLGRWTEGGRRLIAADRELGYEALGDFVDLYDDFSAIAARYEMSRYDVDVTLFRADQIAPVQPADYHWSRFVGGSLTLRTVPGDHHSMFYPEHVAALAAAVRRRLDELAL
jgi:thioesterase domain-containing protein